MDARSIMLHLISDIDVKSVTPAAFDEWTRKYWLSLSKEGWKGQSVSHKDTTSNLSHRCTVQEEFALMEVESVCIQCLVVDNDQLVVTIDSHRGHSFHVSG